MRFEIQIERDLSLAQIIRNIWRFFWALRYLQKYKFFTPFVGKASIYLEQN